MGCRFFAGHCVSNAIMQTLREGGHGVVRLREQLPIESPDAMVIAKAQQLDAILLVFAGGGCRYCDLSAFRLPGDYPLCGGTLNAFPWLDWSRTPSRSSAVPKPSTRPSGCAGRVIHCVSHALLCQRRRGHRPCSRERRVSVAQGHAMQTSRRLCVPDACSRGKGP